MMRLVISVLTIMHKEFGGYRCWRTNLSMLSICKQKPYKQLNLNHQRRFVQQGFSMTEYLLTTMVLVLALFVPLPGIGVSVFKLLMLAFTAHQHSSTYVLSMP